MPFDLVVEGKAVTPRGIEELQFGIGDGTILEVRRQGLKGRRRIDCRGCVILPGFVDAHVHLREPGWEYKEDFATGTAAAVHGGVTTVLDMPNNPVPVTTAAIAKAKARLAASKAHVDVKLFGGVADGSLGDIAPMKDVVVGYKIYLAKSTGGMMLSPSLLRPALSRIGATNRPASVHCEDQALIDAAKRRGGADRPPGAEVESVRRVLSTPTRASVNVCHISTSRALEMVARSKKRRKSLRTEAALHHLYFTKEEAARDRMLRTNPPLRTAADRASLIQGLTGGDVDFLVTDHAPHTVEEKLEGAAGVPGLDNYANLVTWLIERGVELPRAALVTSSNPAAFFGLKDRGSLEKGMRADLTVLDLKSKEKVRRDSIRSKCGWSPYEGRTFPGRARWTISRGRVLLDDFELLI